MTRNTSTVKAPHVVIEVSKVRSSASAVDYQPYEFQRGSNVGILSPTKTADPRESQTKNLFAK